MTQPSEVLYASRQYQNWLSALKNVASLETHNQAQAMMRAVMHELRLYLSSDDVLDFADALPPLPRGIFIEHWRPGVNPPILENSEDFTRRVIERLSPHYIPPDSIVADVFKVWVSISAPANAQKMCSVLPKALLHLWPEQN